MKSNKSFLTRIAGGLLTGFVLAAGSVQAQDIQFSQFYSSSLYLNPAFAGLETAPTANLSVRSQWRAANTPFITTQVSGILPFMGGVDGATQKGGIGVSFFNDQAGGGSLRQTGFMANGAYTMDMQLHKISAGIQAGLVQTGVDLGSQQWGGGYQPFIGYVPGYNTASDAGLASLTNSKLYPLVGLGLMYSYNPGRSYYSSGIGGYAGVSGFNLNQPNISLNDNREYKLPARINAMGGLDFYLSENIRLSPNVLYVTQAGFNQVNAGAYVTFNVVPEDGSFFGGSDLVLGGWHRLGDAYIASLGLQNNAYSFGISFDANSSSYNSFINNRGALEISLGYRFVKDTKRKRFDTPRI